MKKALPVIIVLVLVGIVWFLANSKKESVPTPNNQVASASTSGAPRTAGTTAQSQPNAIGAQPTPVDIRANGTSVDQADADEEEQTVDTKPATEVYSSAEEAFKAVKDAAKDYDDTVLEQFTQPGDDCTWCEQFYASIKDSLKGSDIPQDQKSYFAEILAISGRVDNVKTLVDGIQSAKGTDEADLYAEALELSVGKYDVTRYLGDQMNAQNETLREASVAAITNQGTRLAAELLVKNTVDRGDPDGYYSVGVGAGEFIPDEEAIPVMQQLMQRHDQFSHLGVKSLLNAGTNGLRLVFDELESTKDPEADRKMLKDALDHVNYEDGLEEYLKQKIATTKQPLAAEFAKQILDEFNNQQIEDGQVQTPLDGDASGKPAL